MPTRSCRARRCRARGGPSAACAPLPVLPAPLVDIPLTRIDGSSGSLADHAGKALLIANVASKCGLTPHYAGLEALYRGYRDRGLLVLGFPANDFAGREPGSEAEIGAFCSSVFGVDFPMFAKIAVTGPDKKIRTRAVLPDAETAPMPFRALMASGQIVMRKADGWQSLSRPLGPEALDLAARRGEASPAGGALDRNLHRLHDATPSFAATTYG